MSASQPDERAHVLTRQQNRWKYLKCLYDRHHQLPAGQIQAEEEIEVGRSAGIEDDRAIDRVSTYLRNAGLIEYLSQGPLVGITNAGIDEVEDGLQDPDEPTQHLGPYNVLQFFGPVHDSQIQQGTGSFVQTITASEMSGLEALLREIRTAIDALPPREQGIAAAQIATVEAQQKSPAPSRVIVRESLSTLKSIFEQTVGNVLGTAISTWMKQNGF